MLRKKLFAIVAIVMLLLALTVPAFAFSNTCERFANCGGPGDCAWWGVRCAVDNPWEFADITGVWW